MGKNRNKRRNKKEDEEEVPVEDSQAVEPT